MKINIRKFHNPLFYEPVWEGMRLYTSQRNSESTDEFWLLEHLPVFTQGVAGKPEHVLNAHSIPIVNSDRGGQVTYHGPGQLMVYALLDLKKLGIGARELVRRLEQVVINLLQSYAISANRQINAPGIYVNSQKICSIGLRVRRGCCYHGIALNVDMDLTPFGWINPCGFQNLKMTQLKSHIHEDLFQIQSRIVPHLMEQFGYTESVIIHEQQSI